MKIRIVVVVVFVVILIAGGSCFCYAAINQKESVYRSINGDDFLRVNGSQICNQNGETVVLRGTNLGGWLLQEFWMCPVWGNSEIVQWTNLETLEVLEGRFGKDKTQELFETYQKNWITEKDFQNIASLGFNVVRIPFWYRNFYEDDRGTWINDSSDANPGFQILDWAIETAGKYGLYVILDMHGCPGGQSVDHCSGSARQCDLFGNEQYQNIMEQLWVAIAERYRDNPVVAAYDIMNEGQEYSGEIQNDPRNQLYDRMINSIQQVDSGHIIAVEGIWNLSVLPLPEQSGWKNVIYETHPYGAGDVEKYLDAVRIYRDSHNIPIYIGEFSDTRFWPLLKERDIHYTSWTYKGNQEGDGIWFIMYQHEGINADIRNDPYLVIKYKWSVLCNTKKFLQNEELIKLIM